MPLFPPIFPQSVREIDRGPVPTPGEPLPDAERKIRYVRVSDGQGGWYYYRADTTPGQAALRTATADNVYDRPASESPLPDGYHQVAQTPAAPASVAAPVAPQQPPSAPPQPAATSTGNNYPPAVSNGANTHPNANAGLYRTDPTSGQKIEASGQWVRLSPYNQPGQPQRYGDVIGVDVVRADSDAGLTATRAGQVLQPMRTEWRTSTGNQLPLDLVTSEQFIGTAARAAAASGGQPQVVEFQDSGKGQFASVSGSQEYKVTFLLPNGAKQTFTYAMGQTRPDKDEQGTSRTYVKLVKEDVDTTGMTGPGRAALEKAQTDYQAALADKSRLDAQTVPGQIESQELKNAKDRVDATERAYNTSIGAGNVTHTEALNNLHTSGQIQNLAAQTENVQTNTQVAQVGAQNQTFQNMLQYFRDKVGDETKALELTMQFYNNRANVDQNNNTLANAAGRQMEEFKQGANTQRVSLANNRLSQASSGFTEDARAANDINQYLKPGSSKGADAMMALQAMRYANAKKYGAFDVNDADLRFDPTKLPTGITAFANPSAPSFATYPNIDDMLNNGSNVAARLGGRDRPAPPGLPQFPDRTPLPQPARSVAPSTVNATSAPAPRPNPASVAASVAQPQRAAGNERPDDVLTVAGQQGASVMTRAQYEAAKASGVLPSGAVVKNAESGTLYDKTPEGNLVRRVLIAPEARPLPGAMTGGSSQTPGSTVGVGSSTPQERYDDIVTYAVPPDAMNPNGSVVRYYRYQVSKPETIQEMQRNSVDPNNPVNAQGRETYNAQFPEGDPNRWEAPAYNPERGETSQVQPVSPAAVAELSQPSQSLAYTNQALVADPAEEERRRRQRAMAGMFGSPDAIYGLFDGAYPETPAFY